MSQYYLPLYSSVSVVLSETIGAHDCSSLQNPFRCLTKKNSTTEGCIYNTFHVALTSSALCAKSCVLVQNFCPYLGKKVNRSKIQLHLAPALEAFV